MQTWPPSDDPKVSRSQAVPTDFLGRGAGAILIARGNARTEAAMYVVIRKFSAMRSVPEAARLAESGIGQILKQSPGFVAYYVFDGGNGVGGSVTLFEDREKANAANEKALAWIRGSLFDLIEGDPEIIAGEVLAEVLA
jgi:hypothetical protein